MATKRSAVSPPVRDQTSRSQGEYALMLEVERYESLAEEMEELGVSTLEEVRRKILALHQRLDLLQL